MTRILACLALFLLLIPFSPKRDSPKPPNNSQFISLTPILLNSEHPDKQDIGALKFVSGWELQSKNNSFGGISALLALPKNRFIGLSDSGVLIGFTLANELQAKRPFIAPLPGGPGEGGAKADRDSEAMTYDPSTGRFWVSFEQEHSVWRYARSFARAEISHAHPAMQKWPSNGGAEAMARLTNGKFIVISEGGDGPDGSYGAILFHGDPAEEQTRSELFGYQPPKGFRITDMAQLPDGRMLLLNRKFSFFGGLAAKITIADPQKIESGKVWSGKEIASIAPPLTVDNMEGIAVTREGDQLFIWIISDDNFNSVQRTLLMKFAFPVTPEIDSQSPSSEKKITKSQ